MPDGVWIAAVPLPFIGTFTDKCSCGKRFWGRGRRRRYEIHYRLAHQDGNLRFPTDAMTEVSADHALELWLDMKFASHAD